MFLHIGFIQVSPLNKAPIISFSITIALILFSPIVFNAAGQIVTLRGFIIDQSNGATLDGANIVLIDEGEILRGTVSNADGFYQLTGIQPGEYALRISFVGFVTHQDTLVFGASPLVTHSVALVPGQELDELVIEQEGGVSRLRAGLQQVRPSDLERIPTPDPSGDLATYLQALPGVVSLGDRGGQLYVRGGTPSQNLVLLDGTMMYQPFHIIGFFSAFPQDLISSVDVFAGGFGARYSGRLSSVIDVTMRAGNDQKREGAASIGPFLGSLRLEGPLVKGSLSLLGSVRTSLIEQTAPTLVGESLPLKFSDVMFKLQGTDRNKNRCSLTGVRTYDRGRVSADEQRTEVFKWSNAVLAGHCASISPRSSTFVEANAGFSYTSNAVGDVVRPERSADAWLLNTDLHITYPIEALDLQGGFFLQVEGGKYRLAEQFQGIRISRSFLVGTGVYGGASLKIGDKLDIEPSLAMTFPLNYRVALEPRIRLAWHPWGSERHTTITGAVGLYHQTVEGISDERDVGSVFTAWIPGPVDERRSRALHALLGWQQRLGTLNWVAEGYYKRLKNLPVPIWSALARFTTSLTLADGEVYGVDMRLEYQRRPFYAYIGYGYSWTRYTTAQENFGLWLGDPIQSYHPPHDRRHQVNVVWSYSPGVFGVNLRWQYGTGLPYTRSIGTDSFIRLTNLPDIRERYGNPRFLYERPYEGRLPAYHRLDASLEYEIDLRRAGLTIQAGAINLYDQKNLFYFDLFTFQRVDQLALFPYISILVEVQ